MNERLGRETTLADEGGCVWKFWISKYRGILKAVVWEYERDPKMPDTLTHALFGGWSWSTQVPCNRATEKAVSSFESFALPKARAAVEERKAALMAKEYVDKLPEPSPYVASNYPDGMK